jgi:uncharacterized membrane protein
MNTKIFALLLIAVIASFLGFCIENIFIGFYRGFIDNRNMILPFLFGYGLAILAYYLLFGTPNNPLYFTKEISFSNSHLSTLYCFLISFLGVSIGEIILGHLTEWAFGIIWWDYSAIPLHITRYTSVPTSLCFALLITVFMKYCFTPLLNAFSKMNPHVLSFIALSFLLVLSLDMINSTIYMYKNHDTLRTWRYDFEKPLKDFLLTSK